MGPNTASLVLIPPREALNEVHSSKYGVCMLRFFLDQADSESPPL